MNNKLINFKNIFLCILSLYSANNCLFGQWEAQESNVSVDLLDVCFVDSLHGWIVGDSLTILSTSDGGENWNKQIHPIVSGEFLNIQFINQHKGYIIGEKGLILSSNDGGVNWEELDAPNYDFTDIFFLDENVGWVTGLLVNDTLGIGVILHTTNGGQTWETQLNITSDQMFGGLTLFTQIEMLNDSIGWASGGSYSDNFDATEIYKTENGGNDWFKIGTVQIPISRLRIASIDTLWASPLFFISFDGGVNWINNGPNSITIRRISPLDGLRGWAYLRNNITQERGIYYTSDGGISWESDFIFSGSPFITEISNILGEHLWIVGTNGLIMHKNNNLTSIHSNGFLTPRINLEQNYPNPFNPNTKITFSLVETSLLNISVYNINGELVRKVREADFSAGRHEILFNGSELSSGVYYFRIKSEQYSKSIKMLLLK